MNAAHDYVKDTLLEIDNIMADIDSELWRWQTDLDMMSFIYVNASFELWTNDDPPVRITSEVMTEALVKAAGKELRVMHYKDGKPTQVGTAVIAPDGTVAAKIDKNVPGLAHFHMREDGSVYDNYAGEEIVPPLEKRIHDHKPVQHRDGKPPWCKECGLTASFQTPKSVFHKEN